MTTRKRIPGKTYSLVKAIEGDQMTHEAYELLEKSGIGSAGLVRSKRSTYYLALDSVLKAKLEKQI